MLWPTSGRVMDGHRDNALSTSVVPPDSWRSCCAAEVFSPLPGEDVSPDAAALRRCPTSGKAWRHDPEVLAGTRQPDVWHAATATGVSVRALGASHASGLLLPNLLGLRPL